MYARLSAAYGWAWHNPDGTVEAFILSNAEKYHGMISGYTSDGRKVARPRIEFDALSHDGITWHPLKHLLSQVPSEARTNVRRRDVPLPSPHHEDR